MSGFDTRQQADIRVHIEASIHRLSSIPFILRNLKPMINSEALLIVYYALFQSAISYRILHWGDSVNQKQFLIIEEREIRIFPLENVGIFCKYLKY